jgi:inosose dehydratase
MTGDHQQHTPFRHRSVRVLAPRSLGLRLLDMVEESGVTAIEVTFAPFDWKTACAAFGGAAGLRRELDSRGLSICGGYLPRLEAVGGLDQANRSALLDAVRGYADFLAEMGASAMIGSAPARATRGSLPARFVDFDAVQRISEPLHQIGAATRVSGINFGLHTESHSMMWLPRDIDLFMLATDPFYVGFCPDAGHITLGGGDPVAIAATHVDRLVAAHWKDAVSTISWDLPIDASVHLAHRELCRVPGGGIVDWPAWASIMARAGLTDPVLIEADASGEPVEGIRSAVAYLTPLLETYELPTV